MGKEGTIDPLEDVSWDKILTKVREMLQLSDFHLYCSLIAMRQEETPAKSFAQEFAKQARDVSKDKETLKAQLLQALNLETT